MSLVSTLKPGTNLHGIMEGIILDRDDPDKNGRVGVFIPKVMALIPNSKSVSEESIVVKSTDKMDDGNAVSGVATIKGINYLWAKRASLAGESYGNWSIPPVGMSVFVFFLDDDPTQLYYLPFGPGDHNKLPSSAKNVDDVVIEETLNHSKIGFTGGEDEEFYVELPDGSGIKITPKNKEVLIMTKDKNAKISLKDSDIKVVADKISVDGKEVSLNGDKVIFRTSDAMLWKPNIVPNCPLGGFSHGGNVPGGIKNLKGEVKV